jgi:hypothetical protein
MKRTVPESFSTTRKTNGRPALENAVGIPIATSVEALRDCRQVVIFLQKDEHRESGLDSPGHIGDRAIREPVCREGGAQPLYVSWLRSEGQPVCPLTDVT